MQPEEIDHIIIAEDEAGERLDKILAKRFASIQSRSYFHMLFEEQRILLNGMPVKKRIQPKAGDEVQVDFIITQEIGLTPEQIPLEIIYEDADIIAINKPAGMVVHPAVGNWSGTFVNALLYHCQQVNGWADPSSLRPGIVHRLDKDTSGILVAAKSSQAHKRLVEMFASRQVYKEYLAICLGNPGNARIEAPIGRHPVHRKMMAVVADGGKSALTMCKTLSYDGKVSLVSIELATGRTHQIRVHMKHHGTPVLGDNIYGSPSANAKYRAERQLLHANILRFPHPVTGKLVSLEAPPPADLKEWVEKLS